MILQKYLTKLKINDKKYNTNYYDALISSLKEFENNKIYQPINKHIYHKVFTNNKTKLDYDMDNKQIDNIPLFINRFVIVLIDVNFNFIYGNTITDDEYSNYKNEIRKIKINSI